jgi:hypothetical protein
MVQKGSPAPRVGEPVGWPSFIVFVAHLEPTAAEPEATATKFASEPEAAVAKFTAAESEAAVTKSTAEPEAPAEAAPAEAAPAEAASAKADHVNVGPTSAVTPTSAGNGRLAPTSTGNGRRTQRRAGCGDRRGDQTNRYLAHHDAHFHSF